MGALLDGHMNVKHSLELCPMVVLFHHQGKKQYAVQSGRVFLSLETYISMPLYLEIRGDRHIGALTACWPQKNGDTKAN